MGVPGNPPPPGLADTELFAVDAYRTEFDATVTEVDREGGRVALARTAFYPDRRRPAQRHRDHPDTGRHPHRDRRTPRAGHDLAHGRR